MKAFICIVAALAALVPAAAKEGRGKGKGHSEGQARAASRENRGKVVVVNVFRPADRTAMVRYYRDRRGEFAGKGGDLPPGLRKQLRRNGRLPPGLEKKLAPFPPDVEAFLPPCPPEARRGLIGDIAVMWSPQSGLILDVSAVFAP